MMNETKNFCRVSLPLSSDAHMHMSTAFCVTSFGQVEILGTVDTDTNSEFLLIHEACILTVVLH